MLPILANALAEVKAIFTEERYLKNEPFSRESVTRIVGTSQLDERLEVENLMAAVTALAEDATPDERLEATQTFFAIEDLRARTAPSREKLLDVAKMAYNSYIAKPVGCIKVVFQDTQRDSKVWNLTFEQLASMFPSPEWDEIRVAAGSKGFHARVESSLFYNAFGVPCLSCRMVFLLKGSLPDDVKGRTFETCIWMP